MPLPNIFSKETSQNILHRLAKLSPESHAQWGKMSVAQMLAHCNVTYEMVYETTHPKPNAFMKFLLKMMVKKLVVSEAPYGKSKQTAPQFIIKEERQFNLEQNRLINYITKTQELGDSHFDGKESMSFGKLNKTEWNNMFYKHLDHHLTQFGV